MYNGTGASLALDDGVWNTHLSAEGGQEDDELNRIDIVGDDDQRGLLRLDKRDDVVETKLDSVWLLADVFLLLALSHSRGFLVQALFLLGLGFWTILVEELEELCGGVAIESILELGDGWRDLEAHVQDLALALEADILGPFHHARDVTLRLDILADTEIARPTLDQWVLLELE